MPVTNEHSTHEYKMLLAESEVSFGNMTSDTAWLHAW